MTKLITRDFLRLHGACYSDARIDALGPPEGLPLVDVLKLDIPSSSRLWVATLPGVCSSAIMWEWQARMVERAVARVEKPDPRSLAVVQLLRRLARGEAIPQEQRAAARDDAWAARADAWAARDAARAAAWDAAWDDAWAAAWATAYAAEENQQIADLIDLLTKDAP